MLQEQLKTKIDTSIDPMTSVAVGAALFASTKNIPIDLQKRDVSKVQLTLKYPETTVETDENLGIRIERSQTTKDIPDVLWIAITRSDQGWSSGKVRVEDVEIISILLDAGKSNGFDVVVYDEQGNICPCEPSNFTIIQGLKAATPTLPKSICIDTILMEESGKQRLVELTGLEKNKTLPAKGKGSFKTQKAIRPGKKEDVLRIPIVEGGPRERSLYNETAAIIQLTGEDFAEYLPEGSTIELTVSIDSSRRIILEAYIPDCDETIEKEVAKYHDTEQKEYDADYLHREISKAEHAVNFLDNVEDGSLQSELKGMATQLDADRNDHDAKTKIMEDLRIVLKKIDDLESKDEWPQAEQKLNDALSCLQLTNERYGNAESSMLVSQLEAQAQTIKQQQNIKLANDLCEEIGSLDFSLVRQDIGLWISYLKGFDDDFDSHTWKDRSDARQLINEAKHIISTQPSRAKLESIVFSLFGLLPDKEQPMIDEKDRELLSK
jgi:molecular chaperone DnaK